MLRPRGGVHELAATGPEEQLGGHRVGDRRPVVVDVPIRHGQVEPAVVVRVQEGSPEPQHIAGRRSQAGGGHAVGEEAAAEVLVQRDRLAIEVGHGQVGPAVAVEVATGNTHARQVAPTGAQGGPRRLTYVLESETPEVAVEIVRRHVVGDEDVGLAVVIEVGDDDPQTSTLPVDDP